MATLTIRNLDEGTKTLLRVQAARHGRSMEEEARSILNKAVGTKPNSSSEQGLGSRIQAHFAQLGGVELVLPERSSGPEPAQFNGEKPLGNHNSQP